MDPQFRTPRSTLTDWILRDKLAISHATSDIKCIIDLVEKLPVALNSSIDATGSVERAHDLVVGVGRAVGWVDAFGGEEL